MAECAFPTKSETWKGVRRKGPATCLMVLFKDVLSCTLGNAAKGSSVLRAQGGTKYFTK